MSIDAAAARVSELEQMLRFQAPGTAAQPSASFAAQLSSATTAAAGAAPTASVSAAGAIGNPAHPSSLPAGTP